MKRYSHSQRSYHWFHIVSALRGRIVHFVICDLSPYSKMPFSAIFRLRYLVPVLFTSSCHIRMTLAIRYQFDALKRWGQDRNSKIPLRAIYRMRYSIPVFSPAHFITFVHFLKSACILVSISHLSYQFDALKMTGSVPPSQKSLLELVLE